MLYIYLDTDDKCIVISDRAYEPGAEGNEMRLREVIHNADDRVSGSFNIFRNILVAAGVQLVVEE
jgi:hypothetical protein